MTVSILHAPTRTAFAAATTQLGQCEAVRNAFAGNVTLRIEGAGGVHLRTLTLAPFTINNNTPRGLVCGAVLADTAVSPNTPGAAGIAPVRWEFRDGSTPIFDTTGITQGAIKALCRPTFGSVVFTANPTLPAGGPPFEVSADGIWTWFTMPEAVQVGDFIYLGTVSSDGRCRAHRINVEAKTTETFDLSGVLEIDDHNNASVLPRADGSVVFFYGQHNDPFFRYRIWDGVGSFTASGSWTTEAARGGGDGNYSYPKPHVFANDPISGRLWLFHRRWQDGGGTRVLTYRTSNTLTGTSDPWSAFTDVVVEPNRIPYFIFYQDGNRLHVAFSSQHPVESGFVTIRHCYAEIESGNLVWRGTDGGSALSVPFAPAAATRADNGGDAKRWVSDVGVGADGRPRILWTLYPNGDGSAIEYWHSRWTGTAWLAHKITDDGSGLYPAEQFYHGGLRFKWGDVSRVFLSAPISGVRQVQEWSTSDLGASWSRLRTITSGGTAGNPLRARPIGVHNSDGRVNVLWWEGRYTTYIDYDTIVRASA